MTNLTVVSVKTFGWVGVDYVGRGKNSLLGNPFILGVDGNRDQVIRKYKHWLYKHVLAGLSGLTSAVWRELLRLAKKVKSGMRVALGCWCCPLACHADVVKQCLLWMIDQALV